MDICARLINAHFGSSISVENDSFWVVSARHSSWCIVPVLSSALWAESMRYDSFLLNVFNITQHLFFSNGAPYALLLIKRSLVSYVEMHHGTKRVRYLSRHVLVAISFQQWRNFFSMTFVVCSNSSGPVCNEDGSLMLNLALHKTGVRVGIIIFPDTPMRHNLCAMCHATVLAA